MQNKNLYHAPVKWNKSQYWPRGAPKHAETAETAETAENEKA